MMSKKDKILILRSYNLSIKDIERLETIRNAIFGERNKIVSHGAIVAAGIYILSKLGSDFASKCLEKILSERIEKKGDFKVFDQIIRRLKTSVKNGEFSYLKDEVLIKKISKIASDELAKLS